MFFGDLNFSNLRLKFIKLLRMDVYLYGRVVYVFFLLYYWDLNYSVSLYKGFSKYLFYYVINFLD